MARLKNSVLITDKVQTPGFEVQTLKRSAPSLFYLVFVVVLLWVALVLRLLFDDFSVSMLKGIWSSKQYFIFLRTNKYDSPVPLAYIFLAKNLILALFVYLFLEKIHPVGMQTFQFGLLIKVILSVFFFFLLRSLAELIFNWTIGTGPIFKAFSIQQLFIDFTWGMVLLCICIVCIYNPVFNLKDPLPGISILLGLYLVFNIFKSYQLLSNIRISYRLHFFLYICSFKVLPVLLLAKYLLSNT